jgi:hypothetical protein
LSNDEVEDLALNGRWQIKNIEHLALPKQGVNAWNE